MRRSAFSLLGKADVRQLQPTSDMTYRYPELQSLYIARLRSVLSSSTPENNLPYQTQLRRYFLGELPHCEGIFKSLLQALMSRTTVTDPRCELSADCNTISRVSHPWPARTKKALRVSLDKGTFEDFHFMLPSGLASTKHPMHFAGAVNGAVACSITSCKLSNCHLSKMILDEELSVCSLQHPDQHDAEISLARSVSHSHSFPHSSHRPVGGPLRIMYTPI